MVLFNLYDDWLRTISSYTAFSRSTQVFFLIGDWLVGMHRILILPDTGYPVEAWYRISGGGRIHWIFGLILNSTLKNLVKYEINEDIRCTLLKVFSCRTEDIAFFYIKAVKLSRRHFWKCNELIWLSFKFGRISGESNPVTGRIPYIKNGRINRPDIRCIPTNWDFP
jgi:hypothetical protein